MEYLVGVNRDCNVIQSAHGSVAVVVRNGDWSMDERENSSKEAIQFIEVE